MITPAVLSPAVLSPAVLSPAAASIAALFLLWGLSFLMFSQIDFGLYRARRPKLRNYTEEFQQMIKKLANLPSIMILNLGGRGSGKTANMFKLCMMFINNMPQDKCAIAIYNAPQSFMESLSSYMPPDLRPKFFSITKIRELDALKKQFPYLVLCYDEGQKDLNAKQALTKTARRLEKLVAISRHKNLSLIYNTQIENVTKNMRSMTDLRCYKGNTDTAIEESKNPFAKKYKREILRLMREDQLDWCIFENSYSHFVTRPNDEGVLHHLITIGRIRLPLFDLVPFWNSEISKAYSTEDVSFDSEFSDFLAKVEVVNQCADLFLEAFPDIVKRDITASAVRGWLCKAHVEIYYDLITHGREVITRVVDEINARLLIKKQEDLEAKRLGAIEKAIEAEGEEEDVEKDGYVSENKAPLPEFSRNALAAMGQSEMGKVAEMVLSGYSQAEVARKINKSDGTVNGIWKLCRQDYMGEIFERWFASQIGGVRLGDTGAPDCIGPNGAIFSCKFKYQGRVKKAIEFIQSEDLAPEQALARSLGTCYYLALFYARWDSQALKIIEVDPNGREVVTVFRETQSIAPDLTEGVRYLEFALNSGALFNAIKAAMSGGQVSGNTTDIPLTDH